MWWSKSVCAKDCRLKKTHSLKIENYVLFGRQTEDLSPVDSLSDGSEGLLWRSKGGARIYRNFRKKRKKKAGSWNIKRLLIKERKMLYTVHLFIQ